MSEIIVRPSFLARFDSVRYAFMLILMFTRVGRGVAAEIVEAIYEDDTAAVRCPAHVIHTHSFVRLAR